MTNPTDIDGIDALYREATDGPWECDDPGTDGGRSIGGRDYAPDRSCSSCCTICDEMHEDNAELVVALRNAWPALRDELRELRGTRRRGHLRKGVSDGTD